MFRHSLKIRCSNNVKKYMNPPRFLDLSKDSRLDIRAHQRTCDGAYVRTSFSCLSFSLVVFRFFSRAFFPIGILFVLYGILTYILGYARLSSMDELGETTENTFITGGNGVIIITSISFLCYVAILILIICNEKF